MHNFYIPPLLFISTGLACSLSWLRALLPFAWKSEFPHTTCFVLSATECVLCSFYRGTLVSYFIYNLCALHYTENSCCASAPPVRPSLEIVIFFSLSTFSKKKHNVYTFHACEKMSSKHKKTTMCSGMEIFPSLLKEKSDDLAEALQRIHEMCAHICMNSLWFDRVKVAHKQKREAKSDIHNSLHWIAN